MCVFGSPTKSPIRLMVTPASDFSSGGSRLVVNVMCSVFPSL